MGDMADYCLSDVLDYEDLRLAFHMGHMDQVDAFEHGLIDPLGYEYPLEQFKTCRCCGKSGLRWGQHLGRWRLYEDQHIHNCPVNPLTQEKK